ncbi:MAG: RNA polymerase sigma factor [Acidobacteriota bacterium]
MTDATTDRLLDAAQQGDREALDALLDMHRDRVFRYGLRVCRSTEDAEDAVQETLWSAARSIRSFRRASSVSTWLFTIVRNYCLRLMGREPFYVDLDQAAPRLAETDGAVDDPAVRREVQDLLARALARLEPAHRAVILLRDVEGLTAPEAASALGITVAALKSRLHRARDELRFQVRSAAVPPSRL